MKEEGNIPGIEDEDETFSRWDSNSGVAVLDAEA